MLGHSDLPKQQPQDRVHPLVCADTEEGWGGGRRKCHEGGSEEERGQDLRREGGSPGEGFLVSFKPHIFHS